MDEPTFLLEMVSIFFGGRPRTRAGSFLRSPEVIPSSSEKSRWPVSVVTRWMRETRESFSRRERVFWAKVAPLAPVTPTVMMDALVEGMIFRGYAQSRSGVVASQAERLWAERLGAQRERRVRGVC